MSDLELIADLKRRLAEKDEVIRTLRAQLDQLRGKTKRTPVPEQERSCQTS
jgi:uncharacterized coiled-coil protein SlyX